MILTIEFGNIDRHGKQVIISGMKLPEKVHLSSNFGSDILGLAFPFVEDGILKAECKFVEGKEPENGYPAIGFLVIEKQESDDKIVFTKSELKHVAISQYENADPLIQSIQKQLQNTEG